MKYIPFILACLLLFSCKNEQQLEKEQVIIDEVSASETYQKYVAAYEDYQSCKQERPQLTQDFMEKKITGDEFRERLKINGKACNIKKDIFNRYYRLLQAEFEKEAAAYEIKEE